MLNHVIAGALLCLTAAPAAASGAHAAQDAAQPHAQTQTQTQTQPNPPAPPQTVDGELTFLHEDGKPPFNKVFTDAGPLVVKATIAGADTAAMIDLSTERSLVDAALVRRRGVKVDAVTDQIEWRAATYDRARAHSVSTVLDGQIAITSDVSAVELSSEANPGALGYVLGRGLLEYLALIVVLMEDTRFYGFARSGTWVMKTQEGARADFPYENAVITLDINGAPLRLFVDLTTRRELELVPAGWTKAFGAERGGLKTIKFGPFTRDVNASLLITAPPIAGVDGMIGLGFLENLGIALDAPAKSATLIGAPVLPLPPEPATAATGAPAS